MYFKTWLRQIYFHFHKTYLAIFGAKFPIIVVGGTGLFWAAFSTKTEFIALFAATTLLLPPGFGSREWFSFACSKRRIDVLVLFFAHIVLLNVM